MNRIKFISSVQSEFAEYWRYREEFKQLIF